MMLLKMLKTDKTIRLAFILTLLIWLLLATFIVFGFSRYYSFYYLDNRQSTVNMIAPHIENYSERLGLLSTHINEVGETISDDEFQEFSEELFDIDTLEYVLVSPTGTVANVYPPSYYNEFAGDEILADFTLDEFSEFNHAIQNDTFFLTYEYLNDEIKTVRFNKSILDDEDSFVALITIAVNIDTFEALLPSTVNYDETVVLTEDHIVLVGSNNYEDESYQTQAFEIDGYTFQIATDYHSSYFYRSVVLCFLATLIITIPLLIVFVVFYEDQKYTKVILDELEYSRKFSLVTGLKNAVSFYDDVELLIANDEKFFLALGIFNNIKYMNDNYGHILGSDLILQATKLINGVLRKHTEMYHIGGDEYIFIIKTDRKGEVNNILKRVLKIFDRDIVIDRVRTNISMSMGVVSYPTQGRTIDELIKKAHLTLSNSNIQNSNAFAFYQKDAISNMIVNHDFDNYVKHLNLELFEVYLMPIIHVDTNLIAGFECLTRAFNEFDEVLDTESVINSLERNGRIQELDELVFIKMLRMMRRMNIEYPENEYFLSVNASALSFNEAYVNKITELYLQENFTKGTIVLELTESYRVDDYDYIIRLFKRLNSIGIKTAIDDFGSGYSSLSYISKFPIYAIKVDKEYVRDYSTNSFNRTLFMTLRSIADVLDCKLVAEGVDDPETLDFLKTHNCQLYQGFLFSKGVTFENSLKMIKKNLKTYKKE